MANNFSFVLKQKRLERGLSIKSLAQKADITAKYLSSIENKRRIPSAKVLSRLLDALDIEAFSDLPFFEDEKANRFFNKITPFISKIDKTNLDAIAEMMRIMATNDA